MKSTFDSETIKKFIQAVCKQLEEMFMAAHEKRQERQKDMS
jgi:hypothetical protein